MNSKLSIKVLLYFLIPTLSLSYVLLRSDPIKETILIDTAIKTDINKLWNALTNEKELSKWWGKGVRLEPRVGGAFYEPWGEGQLATGKVLSVERYKVISFTWREKSWKELETTVCTFTLVEESGVVTLRVEHSGWESFKNTAEMKKGFERGWAFLLPKLEKHLE